jgi:hypothetical protein
MSARGFPASPARNDRLPAGAAHWPTLSELPDVIIHHAEQLLEELYSISSATGHR